MTAPEGFPVPIATRPPRAPHADAWALDPGLVFLNHGSFGACPRSVLAVQAELRAELEANPVAFLGRALEGRLDEAREVTRMIGRFPVIIRPAYTLGGTGGGVAWNMEEWWGRLVVFTGSKRWLAKVRRAARGNVHRFHEDGRIEMFPGKFAHVRTEQAVFTKLHIPYVTPRERV